jgi:hypothetical protein
VDKYFKEKEPAVTSRDVNNLVHHSPHLKALLASGMIHCYYNSVVNLMKLEHKKIKEAKKLQFDREVERMKKKMQNEPATSRQSDAPMIVELEPTQGIEDKLVFVKFESPNCYAWVLRHDLGL